MAERRMISKIISISEKVNSLSLFGRLLYTWMIPHADDFGRLPGSPVKVKALVVPLADESIKDVEEALAEMHRRGLILWYEVNGEKFIQITNFEKHQQGLHKRTKSKFPAPPSDIPEIPGSSGKESEQYGTLREAPGNSEKIPLELELELEQNKNYIAAATIYAHAREEQGETREQQESQKQDQQETFFAAHERIFGFALNPFQAEKIAAYIEQDGVEEAVVIRAMERAATKGVGYRFGLITKILDDYVSSGAKTLQQAIALDAEFEKRRQAVEDRRPRGQSQPRASPKPKLALVDPTQFGEQPELSEEERERIRRMALKRDGKLEGNEPCG